MAGWGHDRLLKGSRPNGIGTRGPGYTDRVSVGNYRHGRGRVVVSDTAILLPLPFTHTMSDSDGDFSDELLELAGATEKKRKRREGTSKSGAKRRKAE